MKTTRSLRIPFLIFLIHVGISLSVKAQCLILNKASGQAQSQLYEAIQDKNNLLWDSVYSAYFFGETHTRNFEPIFKFSYIKLLNKQQGIRDIFMEFGFSAAVIFNEYLSSGDTNLLNLQVLYTSQYYKDMWMDLYRFNQQLPDNQKLKIHGVDFESSKTVFKALSILLNKNKQNIPTNTYHVLLKQLHALDSTQNMNMSALPQNLQSFTEELKQQGTDLKAIFGENIHIAQSILHNDIRMLGKGRDKKIFRNMRQLIDSENIKQFVAFYGSDHINYKYRYNTASRFKRNKQFRHSMFSLRTICFDAYDNWSHSKMDCIGMPEGNQCKAVKSKYLPKDKQASICPDKAIAEAFLKGTADAYLFCLDDL